MWQQETLRFSRSREWDRSAQGEDPLQDSPNLSINRNQALRVQFTEGDMERPLFGAYLPQAVQRQVDAFAAADPGGADEQECIRVEIIGSEQLLLQELIVQRGKRSWKIVGRWREIFSTDEIGLDAIAAGGEIVQQTAEDNEAIDAGFDAQGWLPFTQPVEPAEQMRIPAQVRDLAKLREGGAEIRQKL